MKKEIRAAIATLRLAGKLIGGALRSAYHTELAVIVVKEGEMTEAKALEAIAHLRTANGLPTVPPAPAIEPPSAEVIPFPKPYVVPDPPPAPREIAVPLFISRQRFSVNDGPHTEYSPTFQKPNGGLYAFVLRPQIPN